ncbi:unnamed protein product [Closterium sp. NIES-53]
MFGITYATPASIAYAEAESAAAAAAIAEEDRGTGDDEIGEHGRLEGGRGLEERRAEGESGDDEPPLELPLRVYLYPLPAAFNFGLLQAQWNVGCRLDILARHGVPPSWNFNSSSSSSSSSSATSSSLATSADDDADGDGDNSLDQAAAATVRAEEAADGERGERGAGGSNKAMKGVHLPMLEQADELARLAGWSEEAVAVQVPCYHNFPYYWQHSVEYYMTLSLLFGACVGGWVDGYVGGCEGSEAVVRVEDPSHADVVFLPYFSTLAFRLKARQHLHGDGSPFSLLSSPSPLRPSLATPQGQAVRRALAEVLVGQRGVVFEAALASDEDNIMGAAGGLRRAKYCLSPEGDTSSSCRLYDSILSGCIPVVVSDSIELPFEDGIDYSSFALFVPTALALRPGHLLELLRGQSRTQWQRRWSNMRRVRREGVGGRGGGVGTVRWGWVGWGGVGWGAVEGSGVKRGGVVLAVLWGQSRTQCQCRWSNMRRVREEGVGGGGGAVG